jgi:hypothetical protein
MNPRKLFLLLGGVILIAAGVYGMRLLWRGFSTADQPYFLETAVARTAGLAGYRTLERWQDEWRNCQEN